MNFGRRANDIGQSIHIATKNVRQAAAELRRIADALEAETLYLENVKVEGTFSQDIVGTTITLVFCETSPGP